MPKAKSISTLARSTTLRHPAGITIDTPLLVPSISSKGFGVDFKGRSQAAGLLAAATEILTNAVLISAYDIYYKHIPTPASAFTEIFILDSGGYEIADVHDLSTIYHQSVAPEPWSVERLYSVLDLWPEYIPAIFVSYDNPTEILSIDDQIERAKPALSRYPGQLHCFLLKPTTERARFIDLESITPKLRLLGDWDVIGITEKELGRSIIDRMKNVALLRFALDDLNIRAPLHVFGSLDPISSVLYFISGAEIFDGLTWLRFGYAQGTAVYRHNYAALRDMLKETEDQISARILTENYYTLSELRDRMLKFLLDGSFSGFGSQKKLFEEAFKLLRTRIGRLR